MHRSHLRRDQPGRNLAPMVRARPRDRASALGPSHLRGAKLPRSGDQVAQLRQLNNAPNADAPPLLLAATRFRWGEHDYAVLSFPIGTPFMETRLTNAERQVVTDVIRGLSNRAIAAQRRRSPRTVANQVASAYSKLGLGSRAELVAYFIGGPAHSESARRPR